jgi:MFS family permease
MDKNGKPSKPIIYLLVFLFTLHLTPAVYINSSFLEQFTNAERVGFIYSIASILTILAFFALRKFLKSFGNYKTIISLISIEIITLAIMAITKDPTLAISAYIIGFVTRSLVFFNMDIFLESASSDKNTGGIRGYYMTFLNLAFLIGPFIASFVLTDHDFWKIYIIGIVIQIPVLYIIIKFLKNFKDPIYKKPQLWKTFLKLKESKDLFYTFISAFLLRFFFSWMVVYTPIFLTTEIGFTLSQTTLIIGIALIPFVLLEILLGKISDKYIGEKEILTTGFIITGISTMAMAFITSNNLIIWAAILFITRIGATMIEIMSEIHLFKRINASNINILGLFRSVRPVAYMISPLIASILLLFTDFKNLFLVLGLIMLYGVRFGLSIKDSK